MFFTAHLLNFQCFWQLGNVSCAMSHDFLWPVSSLTLPSCRAAVQVQHPQQGPPEQRVPQPGVRGEPVHIAGRLLQLRLHHSHLICPEGHASRWLYPSTSKYRRVTVCLFVFYSVGKLPPHLAICHSGHCLAEWTWLRRAHLVASSVKSLCLWPHWLTLRRSAGSFSDVCDKKRHEVSPGQAPRSDGESSRQVRLFSANQTSTLERLFVPRCCIHGFVSTSVFFWTPFFIQMLFLHLLQQEEEIQSVKRGLHALFFPWWSLQLHSKAPQLKNDLPFEIGSPSFRFVQVLPNVPCYCWFNWECYWISIYL